MKNSPAISSEGVFLLSFGIRSRVTAMKGKFMFHYLLHLDNLQVWSKGSLIYFPMYLYCLRFIINPISLLVFKTTVHQFNFTVMWLFNLTTQTKSERTIQVKAGFEITSPKVQVSKVQDCQFPDDQTSFVKVVDLQVSTRDVLFHGKD